MYRLSLAIAILLGGCAQTKYVATAKPFINSVKPVCISKTDQISEPTAQQIEGNNLALSRIYGKKATCKASTPRG